MFRPLSAELAEKTAHWQNRVREPALTVLLLEQVVTLFLVGPLLSARVLNYAVMDVLQILLLLTAWLALPPRSKVRLLIMACLVPMGWLLYAGPDPRIGLGLHAVGTLGITVAVAQAVFRAQRITRHQLLGAVVVYLNLALLFVAVFTGLNTVFPGAFATSANAPIGSGELSVL